MRSNKQYEVWEHQQSSLNQTHECSHWHCIKNRCAKFSTLNGYSDAYVKEPITFLAFRKKHWDSFSNTTGKHSRWQDSWNLNKAVKIKLYIVHVPSWEIHKTISLFMKLHSLSIYFCLYVKRLIAHQLFYLYLKKNNVKLSLTGPRKHRATN